jgi:hypothetical protein
MLGRRACAVLEAHTRGKRLKGRSPYPRFIIDSAIEIVNGGSFRAAEHHAGPAEPALRRCQNKTAPECGAVRITMVVGIK